jgi:hypothetical protein
MRLVLGPLQAWSLGLLAAAVAGLVALLAIKRLRAFVARHWPWLAGAAALALAVVFVLLHRSLPPERLGESALPWFFERGYWAWLWLFLVGAAGATGYFVRTLHAGRAGAAAVEDDEGHPDLDAAWDEILVRLAQARIEPATRNVLILLAPDEAAAASLVRAAGLQVFAEGPEGPAPIHAWATSESLILGAAGISHLGAVSSGTPEALAALCRKLRALNPDAPGVRGVVVVFPMDWAQQADAPRLAAAVRDDLRTLRDRLGLRCPVYALFTGMEALPGFPTFVARLAAQVSPQMVDQRVGFGVPRAQDFSPEIVNRGLPWMSGWLHSWVLNLLAGDPMDHAGNARLVGLEHDFLRLRRRLAALLESAFATHRDDEPIPFRGAYFVATGATADQRAFVAGLLRGPRSRIIADHVATHWAEEAERDDRRYNRAAWIVLIVGGLLGLAGWAFVIQRVPLLGWAGLLALAAAWVVVLTRPIR